ncbi:MAG: alpha/beta fold hydrolase [Agathobacter sp.]|nr:alpha/beta fold hydrolase [Agathobacter sp.]
MITKEFSFLSYDKKTNIHGVKWIPDSGEYKAILQISHGMVEYIERYAPFAEYLTSNGYMVVGHDHLGHGQSVVSKEDWGFFAEHNPSGTLVEDMHTLRKMIQSENPKVPYFMLGHSMGSYMLRKYLTIYNDNLRGVILSGTGFEPDKKSKMGLRLIHFVKFFRGWRHRSQFIANMTYDKPYKKFDTSGKDYANSWLSRNEENVREYYADERSSFIFTLNGYQGLLEAVRYDCMQENVDKVPNKLPIFMVSGDDDPVGRLGEGVKEVYYMFQNSGKVDITYKLYEGFRHEILNEIGKEEVYEDLLAWMNVRIVT